MKMLAELRYIVLGLTLASFAACSGGPGTSIPAALPGSATTQAVSGSPAVNPFPGRAGAPRTNSCAEGAPFIIEATVVGSDNDVEITFESFKLKNASPFGGEKFFLEMRPCHDQIAYRVTEFGWETSTNSEECEPMFGTGPGTSFNTFVSRINARFCTPLSLADTSNIGGPNGAFVTSSMRVRESTILNNVTPTKLAGAFIYNNRADKFHSRFTITGYLANGTANGSRTYFVGSDL